MRILLAGPHRNGSTWVANVLRQSPGLRVVYEPDEPGTDILGTISSDRLGRYPALRPEDADARYATVWDVAFRGGWPWRPSPMRRRLGRVARALPPSVRGFGLRLLARGVTTSRSTGFEHVLVKSTNCALSLEWVVAHYEPRVVLQRRNPMSLVASWSAVTLDDDATLLAENALVRERWIERLQLPVPSKSASHVERIAWTVGLLTVALKETSEQHPEWIVISYDDLCRDPVPGFSALCDQLGLTWSDAIAGYIQAADRPDFVDKRRNPRRAPDDTAATTATGSRRQEQAQRSRTRLTDAQQQEAREILDGMPLGSWA